MSKEFDLRESCLTLAATKCQTSPLQSLKDFFQTAPVDLFIAGMNEDIIMYIVTNGSPLIMVSIKC